MNTKRTHQPAIYWKARQLASDAIRERRNTKPRTDRHAALALIAEAEARLEAQTIVFPVFR